MRALGLTENSLCLSTWTRKFRRLAQILAHGQVARDSLAAPEARKRRPSGGPSDCDSRTHGRANDRIAQRSRRWRHPSHSLWRSALFSTPPESRNRRIASKAPAIHNVPTPSAGTDVRPEPPLSLFCSSATHAYICQDMSIHRLKRELLLSAALPLCNGAAGTRTQNQQIMSLLL